MAFFKGKSEYAQLIASLNNELEIKSSEVSKLSKTIKKQNIRISDLEDNNNLLKKMLTEKDMKMIKKDLEIKELKEKIAKLQNTPLRVVK